MSIWAHIEAHLYFKEKVTIKQLQKLQSSLIIHPRPKYSNAKEGDYTFKNHFIGTIGQLTGMPDNNLRSNIHRSEIFKIDDTRYV